MMGLGCGLVVSVSVRAFYSEDPNSNPAELYIVFCIIIWKKSRRAFLLWKMDTPEWKYP